MFKILLSATLFSVAFLFSDMFGFLVILSLILLFFISKSFLNGVWWGVIAFSLHFIWLYQLLITNSDATFLQAILIYLFVVFYTSFFSGAWFFVIKICEKTVQQLFLKILIFISTTTAFFYFMQNYSLMFLGRVEGYPFLNPFLPLARYRWFLFLYSISCLNFNLNNNFNYLKELEETKKVKLFYLKPCTSDPKKQHSPTAVGQDIYKKLIDLNLEGYSKEYEKLIVVAPETTYPFALNEHLSQLGLWNCVIPSNTYFLLGSQRREIESLYQTVFLIQRGRIINFYDKTHRVAFTEKIPKCWRYFSWSKTLFLKDKIEFRKQKSNSKKINFNTISHDLIIIPKICSELFFRKENIHYEKKSVIFFFVNDSWFCNYFKKLMKNLCILREIETGCSIIYINHKNGHFSLSENLFL